MTAIRAWLISAITRGLSAFQGTPPPLPAQPRRILILKPCCLGDVLFTTPLVAAVRQRYPDVHITFGVTAWARPMVSSNRHLDEVWTLPERWTVGSFHATLQSLHQRPVDLVIVPDRSPLLSLLVALARIPVRVGLDSQGRGFGYTHAVPVPDTLLHEADLYNLLAPALDIAAVERRLHFHIPPEARQQAAHILATIRALAAQSHGERRRLLVVHVGGGINPGMTLARKRWLPERWAIVLEQLYATYRVQIVLVGGPSDAEAVQAVRTHLSIPHVALVQAWAWSALAAFLAQADLFLGHDTGMLHLACAVGTPVVAIFGPSDPQMYGPYGATSLTLWQPTPASPCFQQGSAPPDCPCQHQCMRNIEPQAVYQAAAHLLEGQRHPPSA